MAAPTLANLESICQKPNWRERGSLLARRFARPAALYLTWLLCRAPISANAVTSVALIVGWAAAICVATPGWFAAGVLLLWLWYLLDHVDGQLARWRRAQSVTGIYLDFMMHHLVHPSLAFAVGYGIAQSSGEIAWTLAGASFALGTAALSLANDCRYKAFHAAANATSSHGQPATVMNKDSAFTVHESPGTATKGRWIIQALRVVHHILLRACEIPNVIMTLSAIAACSLVDGGVTLRVYAMSMAVVAPALALLRVGKQVWFCLPDRDYVGHVADSRVSRFRKSEL